MQKMATLKAKLQSYKSQTEKLWKVNQAKDKQLKALKDITSASVSKSTPKLPSSSPQRWRISLF